MLSLRYGDDALDLRARALRALGATQRRAVVVLHGDPELYAAVMASSDTKGQFIEALIATPAWAPFYSIESTDGERWKQLASDFKSVLARLHWPDRLPAIVSTHLTALQNNGATIDAEALSKLVLAIMFELCFDTAMGERDSELFYAASLEWRREIAVKSKGDMRIKRAFWQRLQQLVHSSPFRDGLSSYADDPAAWLSVFAQPLLISPSINIGDIFAAVFGYLRADPSLLAEARRAAEVGDRRYLEGVLLEAIRLQHPFPVLERELSRDLHARGSVLKSGTQVFMVMDKLQQDRRFDPARWQQAAKDNPYRAIPFGAGPRMCIGKAVALELMSSLLSSFLNDFPIVQVRPERGHLYSGRDNDGAASLHENLYQLKVFGRAFWQSMRLMSKRG